MTDKATQGFREGPTYRAATSAEHWDAALKMEADRQHKQDVAVMIGAILLAAICLFLIVRFVKARRT